MVAAALLLWLLLSVNTCRAQVRMEGFPPPDINAWEIWHHYLRVWETVAPARRVDRSPLTLRYCFMKLCLDSGSALPEWGGGGAIGTDLVVVPIDISPLFRQDLRQVTRHEVVHIVLARAYPGVRLPRWLHEGAAMILSGEESVDENVRISQAIFTGNLLKLSSIDSVNSFGRSRAALAYAQSRQSLSFLIQTYGTEVLAELLDQTRDTGDFSRGLQRVISLSYDELEAAIRGFLVRKYRLVFLVADTYLYWLAVVVLFLIAAPVAIARKRKRMRQMETPSRRQTDEVQDMDEDEMADELGLEDEDDGDDEAPEDEEQRGGR